MLNKDSYWLHLNHASFGLLEKMFEKPTEIKTVELDADLMLQNNASESKDLTISLIFNINIWKHIDTLYSSLKDYETFTEYYKLNIEFPTVPQKD